MYLLITFELSEKDYQNKTHEKIYKLLENKFGFKRTWENNELPNNTMIGKFAGVEPYMQIYGKIKDVLKLGVLVELAEKCGFNWI